MLRFIRRPLCAMGAILALAMTISTIPVSAMAVGEDSSSWWPGFSGGDANQAIVDVATPADASTTELLWYSTMSGQGYVNAPGNAIIVDDTLVFPAGTTLYRLDLQTGATLDTQEMDASSLYGLGTSRYSDGMIYVPLSTGVIQAFDSETLEPVWTYTDELAGQANCPITVSDGLVYTGFWTGYTRDANFVCLDAETGELVWKITNTGGYYYVGSLVVGDMILVGSENGASDTTDGMAVESTFRVLDKRTGELVDSIQVVGDQRTGAVYDESSGRLFFTTNTGYLYSVAYDSTTGKLSDVRYVLFENMQSSSTVVVFNGRIYAPMGEGLSSVGYVMVLDADSLETMFRIETAGYPQCTPLVSTAYLYETGAIKIYISFNYPPGGLQCITVDASCTSEADASIETIFDPSTVGASQYCISSPICSSTGVIYFRNDSGNYFALANSEPEGVVRLSGDDRYGTMSAAVEEAFDDGSCDLVVLASGETYPDALTASGLAGVYDAPVVLTSGDSLTSEALEEIERVTGGSGSGVGGLSEVIGVGGSGTIGPAVISRLEDLGCEVDVVAGQTRQETSLRVYEYVIDDGRSWGDKAVIASGEVFADALAGSSYAWAGDFPVFLTDSDGSLDPSISAALAEAAAAGSMEGTRILGGTSWIPYATEDAILEMGLDVRRWAGSDRYATSARVAAGAVADGVLSWSRPAVVSGENFPDALSASSLCGANASPVLLASDSDFSALEEIGKNAALISCVYVVGGSSSVSATVVNAIADMLS